MNDWGFFNHLTKTKKPAGVTSLNEIRDSNVFSDNLITIHLLPAETDTPPRTNQKIIYVDVRTMTNNRCLQ